MKGRIRIVFDKERSYLVQSEDDGSGRVSCTVHLGYMSEMLLADGEKLYLELLSKAEGEKV
jgi:hypothetical protein